MSAEGTTQEDPLAMGLYALSIQPLFTSLQGACKIRQCWFAVDASGAGPAAEIKRWWDTTNWSRFQLLSKWQEMLDYHQAR